MTNDANKAAAAPSPLPSTHRTLQRRIVRWFLIALASYVCFILSLTIPVVQKHFVFAHAVRFPFFADFDAPEEYGLAPNKTRNMRLKGADGNFIGAWHVLPDAVYRSQVPLLIPSISVPAKYSDEASTETNSSSNGSEVFQRALCTHPVVIYLHGNAANRAAPFRTAAYAQLSSRLQANVVAIDYRGFGDSQGTPSEEGLNADARLAWDWVQEIRRACEPLHSPGKDVLVMGQSLGTGPATALTLQLARQGTPPQGLVLLAPYRSFSHLAAGFRIGGILPVLLPALYLFPYAQAGLELALRTKFDSERALAGLDTAIQEGRSRLHTDSKGSSGSTRGAGQASTWPHVVISHAINDDVIPHSHGQAIFDKLLEMEWISRQSLRAANRTPGDIVDEKSPAKLRIQDIQLSWTSARRFFRCSQTSQDRRSDQLDVGTTMEEYGEEKYCPSVALLLPKRGGHNVVSEGTVDLIGELTRVRGNAHLDKAEQPWLPAQRRDRELSYVLD